jgi:hypothetical protein
MLKKLISVHNVFIRRGALLNEIIENAYRAGCLKYFVNKCPLRSPLGGNGQNFRELHIYGPRRKSEDRRIMYASLPARDEGTAGEKGVDIDSVIKRCVFLNFMYFNFLVKFKMAILCCFLAQCHQYDKMACWLSDKGI